MLETSNSSQNDAQMYGIKLIVEIKLGIWNSTLLAIKAGYTQIKINPSGDYGDVPFGLHQN